LAWRTKRRKIATTIKGKAKTKREQGECKRMCDQGAQHEKPLQAREEKKKNDEKPRRGRKGVM